MRDLFSDHFEATDQLYICTDSHNSDDFINKQMTLTLVNLHSPVTVYKTGNPDPCLLSITFSHQMARQQLKQLH